MQESNRPQQAAVKINVFVEMQAGAVLRAYSDHDHETAMNLFVVTRCKEGDQGVLGSPLSLRLPGDDQNTLCTVERVAISHETERCFALVAAEQETANLPDEEARVVVSGKVKSGTERHPVTVQISFTAAALDHLRLASALAATQGAALNGLRSAGGLAGAERSPRLLISDPSLMQVIRIQIRGGLVSLQGRVAHAAMFDVGDGGAVNVSAAFRTLWGEEILDRQVDFHFELPAGEVEADRQSDDEAEVDHGCS